jgi:hypothetical protein
MIWLVNRSTEPGVGPVVARYVDQLTAIGAEIPVHQEPGQYQQPLAHLAAVKENIQTVEAIARGIEQHLATKSSGCAFTKAAGDTIEKEILPAAAATKTALDTLFSETKDRFENLTKENNTLGWVGWRGTREEEIYELLLLAHDISTTAANADLAFSRLKVNATALSRMADTCR